MLSSLFISARETFEAALIIGIILMQLIQNKQKNLIKVVSVGAAVGFIICLVSGVVSFIVLQGTENTSNESFEGIMLLLSALLIAYVPFWIHRHSGTEAIKNKVNSNLGTIGLFLLAFLSVFREGMELVVFTLTKVSTSAYDIALGTILGAMIALALAVLLFKSSIKLNISLIFMLLSIVLIFLGGDMLGEGLAKLFDLAESSTHLWSALFIVGGLALLFQKNIAQWFKKSAS